MSKTLSALASAAALCFGSATQAALVTFDAPPLITIDPNTGVAVYTESGFTISGGAASFLPLDGVGSAGSGGLFVGANSLIKLMAASGNAFSLNALDFGLFDLLDATPSPSLLIQGLLTDNSTLSQTLALGALATFGFSNWMNLKEVSFSANTDFVLDNINAVPEPGTFALAALAMLGLSLGHRQAVRADPQALSA